MQFFDRLIAEIIAQGGFRDYPDGSSAGDIRRPRYEGDFATSTDASKLFEEGVNVPQEAINLSRLSSTRALEKVMPDWAVQQWLDDFLKRDDLARLAVVAVEKFKGSLEYIPAPNRKRYFDYRVKGSGHPGAIFSIGEIQDATQKLEENPAIAAGVLLWQFALQGYGYELAETTLKSDVAEPLKSRLVGYARFLSASAFLLGSFGALLPLAIATSDKNAAEALEDFSARGGFMKQERVNVFAHAKNIFRKIPSPFATPWLFKPRVIICSAKEAIPRWAALPVNGEGSLAAYISTAGKIKNPEWEKCLEKVRQIITAGAGNKTSACPFHGRRSA